MVMSNLSDFLPLASDTWGPSKIDHSHTFVPVEFVGRTEKLGRFCDFTSTGVRARRPDQPEDFQFVDTRPMGSRGKKFAPRAAGQYQQMGKGKGKGNWARGRGHWGAVRIDHRTGKPVQLKVNPAKAAVQRPYWQRGNTSIVKGMREWSLAIKPEYNLLTEINLASIGRKKAVKSEWMVSGKVEFEDLIKCGELAAYDKTWDKTVARAPKPLTKFDTTNFYNVSTSQDPVMEELITRAVPDMAADSVLIACTDQVLSVLMAANRSVYSWDLVITRNGNTILIDKRDAASCIDFATVNENAQDPPSFDESVDPMTQINSPVKLGVEATGVGQNLSQLVLEAAPGEELEYPNPFHDDEDESTTAARTAYVYRKAFIPASANTIGKDLNFIVRGEVNAVTADGKAVAVKALTEYDSKITNWRESFERNRETAVFATEMKNNSCKLARWLASCVVGNCDQLKLGFVARRNEDDPWNHQVLAVQTHAVADLMSQMAMSQQSLWSSVCAVVEQILNIEGETVGRYLVVKDPAKPALNLYAVPWDEFEYEDEEEDEEEGDEDEEDE